MVKKLHKFKTFMNLDEVELQTMLQHSIPTMLQKKQVEWEVCYFYDKISIPKEKEFLQHMVIESLFAFVTRCLLMVVHPSHQSLFHTGIYFSKLVNGFP